MTFFSGRRLGGLIPEYVRSSDFLRQASTIGIGTIVGQTIIVLASPLISRLYSPAEIGAASAFLSCIALSLAVATLRFDLAIPLPRTESRALRVVAVALMALVVVSVTLGLAAFLEGPLFGRLLGAPVLARASWLVGPAVFVAGAVSILYYWAIRRADFGAIARARVRQSVSQVFVQIGGAICGLGIWALLFADLVGRSAAAVTLLWGGRISARLNSTDLSVSALSRTIARYRKFPQLQMGASLMNVASLQLPLLLIGALFGAAQLGQYALAFRVLGVPAAVAGQAIGAAFFARAARARTRPAELASLTRQVTVLLVFGAAPVLSVIWAVGPQLFAAIFGSQWALAGRYSQLLAPWFLLWFVSSPLSGLLVVREWQKSSALFTAMELAARIGSIVVGAKLGSLETALMLLSLSGVAVAAASMYRFLRAGHVVIRGLIRSVASLAMCSGLVACLLWYSCRSITGLSVVVAAGLAAVVAFGLQYLMARRTLLAPTRSYAD